MPRIYLIESEHIDGEKEWHGYNEKSLWSECLTFESEDSNLYNRLIYVDFAVIFCFFLLPAYLYTDCHFRAKGTLWWILVLKGFVSVSTVVLQYTYFW